MAEPARRFEIIVEPDGAGRYLQTTGADAALAGFGTKVETWRNSHVETWSSLSDAAKSWLKQRLNFCSNSPTFVNLWWADMLPVGGPVLGPYTSHDAAISAEIQWLTQNNLPCRV